MPTAIVHCSTARLVISPPLSLTIDLGLPRRSTIRSSSAIRRRPPIDGNCRQALLGEVVDHSQDAKAPPVRQLVLSLLNNMFGLGSGRPTMVSGNSLLGEWSLGCGCDLAIVVRLWAPSHSSGAFVVRNKPRRRNRRTFTAATRG